MSGYNKFYDYLEELHQGQLRLGQMLVQKLEAIQKFDLTRLDEIIREEQVHVLISKSFDANIDKHRAQLSLTGEKLSEMIPELPAEEQPRFHRLFKQLKSSLDESQQLNEKCQELLEERLYSLNKAASELGSQAPYKKGGESPAVSDAPPLLSKSI